MFHSCVQGLILFSNVVDMSNEDMKGEKKSHGIYLPRSHDPVATNKRCQEMAKIVNEPTEKTKGKEGESQQGREMGRGKRDDRSLDGLEVVGR